MDTSWIKLYRKAKDNPIMQDPVAWLIFSWLLLSVDRATGTKKIGTILLSEIFNLSRSTVRDALTRLEKKYKLTTHATTGRYSTISVLHWHIYQSGVVVDDTSDARSTPGRRQVDATIQEYKNKEYIYKANTNHKVNTTSLGSQKANHAELGKVITSSRSSISYPREVINDVVNYYVEKKSISPQGNEWKPIQQTVKTMLMNGRMPQEIKDFIHWLSTKWATWDIHTVSKRIPEFLAGKLDAEKNKINPIVVDPIFQELTKLNGDLTDAQFRFKMMLESKLNTKYPMWRYEKEWVEANKQKRNEEEKRGGPVETFRKELQAKYVSN